MLNSLFTLTTTKSATFEELWQNLIPRLTLPEKPPPPQKGPNYTQNTLEKPLRYSLERLLDEERVKCAPAEIHPYLGGQCYPGFLRRQQAHTAPLAVVRPVNEQEIAALIHWAAKRDIHLLPWGNGTMPYQEKIYLPKLYMVVELSHINRILAFDEEQLTLRVQAGATWSSINQQLQQRGFSTGTSFPKINRTIGGTIATNATNIESLGYGTLAHNLLCIKVITPAGPMILTAPKTGKQDQRALILGANGQGGLITEATVRIYPHLAEKVELVANFSHRELALKALQQIIRAKIQLTSAQLSNTDFQKLFKVTNEHKYLSLTNYLRPTTRAKNTQLRLSLAGTKQSLDKRVQELKEILTLTASQIREKKGTNTLPQNKSALNPNLFEKLWHHNILAYTLFATSSWSSLPHFLLAWEDALTSALQSQPNRPSTSLTIVHALKDYALVETLLLANYLKSDRKTQLNDLARIQSIAQATRQRWDNVGRSTLGAQALLAAGTVLDPQGIIVH